MNMIRKSLIWAPALLCLLACAEDDPGQLSTAADFEKDGLYDSDKLAADYLNPNFAYGEFKDERDGRVYKTIEFMKDTIMAQNLAFADSEMVPELKGNSWCYDDISENCEKGGRLYTYSAAQKVCPEGWYLFWQTYLGFNGDGLIGYRFKSTAGWNKGGNGSDEAGFAVLPAGLRANGEFINGGFSGTLWLGSSNDYLKGQEWREENSSNEHTVVIYAYDDNNFKTASVKKDVAASVRCVKFGGVSLGPLWTGWSSSFMYLSSSSVASSSSEAPYSFSEMTDSRDNEVYKTLVTKDQEWLDENLRYKTESVICNTNALGMCDSSNWYYFWNDAVSVCPEGWHLPDTTEWRALVNMFVSLHNDSEVNTLGFDDVAHRSYNLDGSSGSNGNDHFWAADEDDTLAVQISLSTSYMSYGGQSKRVALSVRCVRD